LGDILGGLLGNKNPSNPGASGGGLGDILGGLLGGKPGAAPAGGRPGGSLSDLLPGGLGGLLGGSAGGNIISGGLDSIIKEMQRSGHGQAAQSWVGSGPNEQIAPDDLAKALGSDAIEEVTKQTGMSRNELLSGLSQHLPELVNQLTPQGRVPTPEEAARMI
jgi:uncharacterized protein YidB (DUF937 family)